MAYSIKRKDGSAQAALRRIGCAQLDAALAEIRGAMGTADTVHAVRKRCKKLRGLIRLVRPGFDSYGAENAALRDIARSLSDLRDGAAWTETADGLLARYSGQIDEAAFDGLRRELAAARRARRRAADADTLLKEARAGLEAVRERAEGWTLHGDPVGDGLKKTYARARKAMAAARDRPTPERMHEWRKRVKYHRYHARLLRRIEPSLMGPHIDAARDLSDLLGEHHDLAELDARLDEGDRDWSEALPAFRALTAGRQREIEREAFRLGGLLLAEKPKALARRWMTYRAAWG